MPDLKLPLATQARFEPSGPSNCEPIALRVTVIGGDGLADDYELLSRGVPIFRILKATGRCPKNGNAGTATSIRKTTGESKKSPTVDQFCGNTAAWAALYHDDGNTPHIPRPANH